MYCGRPPVVLVLFVPRLCSSSGRFFTSRVAADGLVDPLTVQAEQQIPPTDRQMDYALELEAMIPDGVCKDDVSAIISRIADKDEEAPDPSLSRYAHACGIKFSRFVGAKALLGLYGRPVVERSPGRALRLRGVSSGKERQLQRSAPAACVRCPAGLRGCRRRRSGSDEVAGGSGRLRLRRAEQRHEDLQSGRR